MYKPYQKPRPEIVGTVVAPFSKGLVAMGERDFHPLSANFLLRHWLAGHWALYAEGRRRADRQLRTKMMLSNRHEDPGTRSPAEDLK
jgi:hypothetical protein